MYSAHNFVYHCACRRSFRYRYELRLHQRRDHAHLFKVVPRKEKKPVEFIPVKSPLPVYDPLKVRSRSSSQLGAWGQYDSMEFK